MKPRDTVWFLPNGNDGSYKATEKHNCPATIGYPRNIVMANHRLDFGDLLPPTGSSYPKKTHPVKALLFSLPRLGQHAFKQERDFPTAPIGTAAA